MLKPFALCLIVVFLAVFARGHENWEVKTLNVKKSLGAKFNSHAQEAGSDYYLAQDLNYSEVKPFFEKLDSFSYRPLKNRSEAHITVLTPPEYLEDIKKFVTTKEIDQIAIKNGISGATYEPICLGKGSATLSGQREETYFIVVESKKLLEIRQKIAKLYKSRGGKIFDPNKFSPHITLGFTNRDLYISDGVVKDKTSCMPELHISSRASEFKEIPIPNTSKIGESSLLLRGNAPLNYKNLQALKVQGVEQVLIFKNDKNGEVENEILGIGLTLGLKFRHMNFDWKENQNVADGCPKFIEGVEFLQQAAIKKQKTFLHCTTGADRTGALSALYLLVEDKNLNLKTVFEKEMCGKGYEAADPTKGADIVEKIRSGLTKTFLRTALRIKARQKAGVPIDVTLCSKPIETEDEQVAELSNSFKCGI